MARRIVCPDCGRRAHVEDARPSTDEGRVTMVTSLSCGYVVLERIA